MGGGGCSCYSGVTLEECGIINGERSWVHFPDLAKLLKNSQEVIKMFVRSFKKFIRRS